MKPFCFDGRVVQDHFPGIGRYAFNLARGLCPLLEETERLVLLRDPNVPSHYDLRALANERVTVVDVAAPIFSLRQHWRVPALLRRLDVSVYHSPYFIMPIYPGVPAIVTIHDLIPLQAAGSVGRVRKRIFLTALGLALRASKAVLTPSKATAEDLRRQFRLVDGRVAAVLSAVDPSFQPQPREDVERALAKLRLPQRYVLYVGSNRPHKNLPRLIEAWSRVDWLEGPLVVAGSWDARIPAARERVEQLQQGTRVHFLGPVSDEDLRRLYSGTTLFVFPSEYEGFGFPVLEAMACGAPVACSNAGSLVEVVNGAAELFPPDDVDAMASVLTTLLAGADRRAELARLGLQRAASVSWEATSRQVLALYRRVAGLTPSP